MAQPGNRLPNRFPVGSKYVVESSGPFVRRYVEFPNGRRIALPKRKALPCTFASTRPPSEQYSRPRERPEEVRLGTGS